ncbi:MAG: hypothetical protein EA369_03335 [Bradymonadales bacterium]|nr:MAG: hypothetical protein EA369_03335 [Bradymonadales bacterium]
MPLIKFIFLGAFSLTALVACGSDSPEYASVPEYLQNVNLIPYRLTEMSVEVKIDGRDPSENRSMQFQFRGNDLRDELISRVTVGDGYVLQINELRSSLQVGASSRISASGGRKSSLGNCQVSADSEASGTAEFNRIELDYRLTSEVRGSECSESAWERQHEFLSEKLDALGLFQLKNLLNAGLLFVEESRKIELRVRVRGITRVET